MLLARCIIETCSTCNTPKAIGVEANKRNARPPLQSCTRVYVPADAEDDDDADDDDDDADADDDEDDSAETEDVDDAGDDDDDDDDDEAN